MIPFIGGRIIFNGGRWDLKATGDGIPVEIVHRWTPFTVEDMADLRRGNTKALQMASDEFTFPTGVAKFTEDDPMVRVKLIQYNGGEFSAIHMAINHYIFDCESTVKLLRTISHNIGISLLRQSPVPSLPPRFTFRRGMNEEDE